MHQTRFRRYLNFHCSEILLYLRPRTTGYQADLRNNDALRFKSVMTNFILVKKGKLPTQHQVAVCKIVLKQGFKITLKSSDTYETPYVQSLWFSIGSYFRVSCKQKLNCISNTFLNSCTRAQPRKRFSSCGNISIYVAKMHLIKLYTRHKSQFILSVTSTCFVTGVPSSGIL